MAFRAPSKWAVGLSIAWGAVALAARAAPSSSGESVSTDPSSAPPAASSAPAAVAPSSRPKLDPKGKKGISPAMIKLQKGHGAYLARDFAAAVLAYKEATAAAPAEPSGYYFLAEAELAAGNAADAEADLDKGLKNAAGSDEWHTKLLFAVGDLRERQARFVEARKAWEELAQVASAHASTKAAAASALQRIQVIEAHLELETRSAAVKQRIERRLRETGGAPPDEKSPAPAKPKK
jgi:tetratricopeptide (TPR) repeat protein